MYKLHCYRYILRRITICITSICFIMTLIYGTKQIFNHPAQTTAMKRTSQVVLVEPTVFCAIIQDDYYFLDAAIDNQPELLQFIKGVQSIPLILIDEQMLEDILSEESIEIHSIKTTEYFEFVLQQKDWDCLVNLFADFEEEWLFEMTEAGIVFQNKQKSKVKILVRKLIDKTVDYQILLPYSGRVLRTEDHIVAFVRIESFSQVALNGSLLFIPSQPRLFLQRFKRGRFIDCMQPGNGESPIINKKSIQYLAKIRDFFEQFGAMFFLEGGTLLGWYRDCSIIEHTTDLDVSIPIEFYTEAFNRSIFTNDYFRIWKQYGRVNDSLEFVTFLGPFGQGEKLDIFFNYNMFNYSVVGGWAPPDYLLWFKLPKCIGFCSGDLYGRLFAVPCNIKEWLSATYGDDYMTKQAADWERKNGTYSGPQNAQIIGRYNKSDASKTFFHHPFYGT